MRVESALQAELEEVRATANKREKELVNEVGQLAAALQKCHTVSRRITPTSSPCLTRHIQDCAALTDTRNRRQDLTRTFAADSTGSPFPSYSLLTHEPNLEPSAIPLPVSPPIPPASSCASQPDFMGHVPIENHTSRQTSSHDHQASRNLLAIEQELQDARRDAAEREHAMEELRAVIANLGAQICGRDSSRENEEDSNG